MKTLYSTTVTVTGGRNGNIKSDNGVLDLEVRMPKALGGQNDDFTNPEQLFAGGYAACFDSALNLVAQKSKVKIDSTITATVSILPNTTGGFELAVNLVADIQGVDKETAQQLLEKAHQVCPYSNATRGNIEVTISLK
ncbi:MULTISPECIES: organic hydroperoxide resistance protein [Pasteurellaceae]|uniref:Organic hydroperoxide resistance protein n=1 Tax=Pasteurella atlantica TaxID=2827233 RepID=A0AAW8CMD9_9PAST|nr:organic hydroperoxide resistance protein [Pasteurella atlantica]MBR0572622.1 organic hydroperoxide resistance protein [Pasteurella atlantica]MDP8038568.1 organic hydroperoxide resistance protein [Pasteurella atlantica]MDP8040660.1 organic hydroperoxide resistance protein [Pasteurella atlantica]MDP8042795.1 organic hydroperoxide resistance protein [Pasteurella atlantica]MDP8044882.1 organic hydroperoxide resistance protein [Pasteurella atlantica]